MGLIPSSRSHVTRPVVSKGLWRDVKLCHEMDAKLAKIGQKAVLFILTSAGGVRRFQDVAAMEKHYGWPRHHRAGYPDLVGPEADIHAMIEPFNRAHEHVQIVLVNQFGWSRDRIGRRLPEHMDIADLRRATDVELGMATYEPFGISPLEPLGAGAICVISSVCGCKGFVDEATDGRGSQNVIVADFTTLDQPWTITQLKAMTQADRDAIEQRITAEVAEELMARLPQNDQQRKKLIAQGQLMVKNMGWDHIVEKHLLPLLNRIREPATEE